MGIFRNEASLGARFWTAVVQKRATQYEGRNEPLTRLADWRENAYSHIAVPAEIRQSKRGCAVFCFLRVSGSSGGQTGLTA